VVKLKKRDVAFIIIALVIIITFNAWWRVKETGRRARFAAEQEALMRDAAADVMVDAETE
jgi:hypothetical protein